MLMWEEEEKDEEEKRRWVGPDLWILASDELGLATQTCHFTASFAFG